jgi:hypothetical protein
LRPAKRAIGRRSAEQEGGGPGPIPGRAIHAAAGIRMLIGGAVTLFLGIVAMLASLSG